jgi:hypothetical protein
MRAAMDTAMNKGYKRNLGRGLIPEGRKKEKEGKEKKEKKQGEARKRAQCVLPWQWR